MPTKKQQIIEYIREFPFMKVEEYADKFDTTTGYIWQVLRENDTELRVERAAKFLEMKNKYEKLSHEYTDLVIDKAIAEKEPGKLQKLFNLQKKLQDRLNDECLPQMKPERIPMTVTSIIGELGEILEEQQAWKDWKENPEQPNMENLRMEVADIWHFVINLTLYLGMDAEDLYQEFIDKNKVNHQRQDNDY